MDDTFDFWISNVAAVAIKTQDEKFQNALKFTQIHVCIAMNVCVITFFLNGCHLVSYGERWHSLLLALANLVCIYRSDRTKNEVLMLSIKKKF